MACKSAESGRKQGEMVKIDELMAEIGQFYDDFRKKG